MLKQDTMPIIFRYLPVMKTGIIVQARVGSSRLPFKVVLPFYNSRAIIEIILDELIKHGEGLPMVLATTISADDDVLCRVAGNMDVDCLQGPEQDVLGRFILAAEKHGFERIVRICADNPFLDVQGTMKLLEENDSFDYVSYRLQGGLPSIKSHLGLWGEVVTLAALKKIKKETSSKLYHEHVTNYIYGNPDRFSIKWVDAPGLLFRRKDIRLTIDDEVDFNLGRQLISEIRKEEQNLSAENLLSFLDRHPHYLQTMDKQIRKYTK